MIGSSGTLVDRKGSYVIPKIEKTSTTKTYTMRLPYGAVILASNVTIISGSDSLTYDNVTYTVKKEYADIVFSVPITEPVTIYTYKSISYVDPSTTQIKLSCPVYASGSSGFVVYNGAMHFMYSKSHYKWNGVNWVVASTITATNLSTSVVYNNEIHYLGNTSHYKWNGTSWSNVSTLPVNISSACVTVYNNEIHILGGATVPTAHYKWNGTSWVQVSTLPFSLVAGGAVSYKNELHIFGGNNNDGIAHYKWNGTSWTQDVSLSEQFADGSCTVYNDCIYILGGRSTTKSCRYFDGTSWKTGPSLTIDANKGCCTVYNNELHVMYNLSHIKYSIKTGVWTNMEDVKTFSTLKNVRIDGNVVTSIGKQSYPNNDLPSLIEF